DYYVWWGYEDTKLFEYAKEELGEISKEEEPFNMTILTVDTHSPNGYTCDKCEDKYDEQYKNVLACSSKQVADFVKWVQKQDFYDNTTIVLAGDHITKASFSDFSDVDVSQNRVYECFINSAIEPKKEKERKFNTMDMYPTTLAALGVDIEGNRLGLGTNLFSSEETISEKIGYERIDEELSMKSKYYDKYIVK
ncbi:MAG: sulfatase-like hydrolase/transferase, partial [Lachnospiraceae bacterium]|nr:sulfatase-like hydrolase/transferase [Lachnospiraceae bacterium]